MSPDGGRDPAGPVGEAITAAFGSARELRRVVSGAGSRRFGSGWVWLIHDGDGLAVTSTANDDMPVMSPTRSRSTHRRDSGSSAAGVVGSSRCAPSLG
jgi:superoxide dismutase